MFGDLHSQHQRQDRDVPRETLVALRARRKAYRIATDIQYHRRLDVRQIECPACHSRIEPSPTAREETKCRACGQRVPLPCHLRLRPLRTLTPEEAARVEEDARLTLNAEAGAARQERCVLGVWLILGAVAVIVFFLIAYYIGLGDAAPQRF